MSVSCFGFHIEYMKPPGHARSEEFEKRRFAVFDSAPRRKGKESPKWA